MSEETNKSEEELEEDSCCGEGNCSTEDKEESEESCCGGCNCCV